MTGDGRYETGGTRRNRETGDERQEAEDRSWETGNRRQGTQEMGDGKIGGGRQDSCLKIRDEGQEAGDQRHERRNRRWEPYPDLENLADLMLQVAG